jgi:hypothetical protein
MYEFSRVLTNKNLVKDETFGLSYGVSLTFQLLKLSLQYVRESSFNVPDVKGLK